MTISTDKLAIVTGANKGIGKEIVKQLCKQFKGTVYLTSRNEQRGKEAVDDLKQQEFFPKFHQLDITDENSVKTFRKYLAENYEGIDLLVNNAGIRNATDPVGVQAEVTLETNYFGLVRICNELFPLLKNNARVVNVSSSSGHLSRIPSKKIRDELSNENLTIEELNKLMNSFIKDAKDGKELKNTWGNNCYIVSKVGVSALTRIQQRLADAELKDAENTGKPKKNLYINSVHPGYVKTDMTSGKGLLTVEEGAKAPMYLAIGDHQLKGRYIWKDCTDIDWLADSIPPIH